MLLYDRDGSIVALGDPGTSSKSVFLRINFSRILSSFAYDLAASGLVLGLFAHLLCEQVNSGCRLNGKRAHTCGGYDNGLIRRNSGWRHIVAVKHGPDVGAD
jgi:hypothetical protein